MRVVVAMHSVGWGGSEVNTLGVLRALAAAGHEVVLAQCGTPYFDRMVPDETSFERRHVDMPVNFEVLPFGWWRSTLGELRPDVLVLSKGWFDLINPAFDVAARLVARRYVVLEHHPASPMPPRTSKRHLGGLLPGLALWHRREMARRRFHVRAPHRVIVDSQHVANILHDTYGLPRSRTVLVHPGTDGAVVRFTADGRARARAGWGVPADALVVGSVGRLATVKRLARLVRAFAALRAARPSLDAWLVLAGEGPLHDDLLAEAEALGIAERVVLPGYAASAADALSGLDVYALCSEAEGFGIALIEAMACERACVATDSGGPAEILTDPSLGWLTPLGDQAALDGAVNAAATMTADARRALGARARTHVRAHFDRARQMRRIAELIVSA